MDFGHLGKKTILGAYTKFGDFFGPSTQEVSGWICLQTECVLEQEVLDVDDIVWEWRRPAFDC